MFLERIWWTAYLAYHWRGQARYPFKPLGAIRRHQARRVRKMVAYAYRHVAYYRETMDRLGLSPADFQAAEDLAKLPILEREQLQRDPQYFVAHAQPPEHGVCIRSSGSSGVPLGVWYDPRAMFQIAAHTERARSIVARLIGRSIGYRETAIASGSGGTAQTQQFWRANALLPHGSPVRRQALAVLDPPQKNVPLLNEFKPDLLNTYGSYLGILFHYLRDTGQPFHRPKVIVYGGDCLEESVRRLIQDEFQIPIVGGYGAIEAHRIAFECERHAGMHVNIDIHPIRTVGADGRDVPPGEPGDVIVSNLVNRATVLLNYRLGDIAALLPEPCPCGRSLPLMSFPLGRSDDLIVYPSGEIAMPYTLRLVVAREPAVRQYQAVQETPTRFRISIVTAPGCDRDALRRRVLANVARTFGQEVEAEIVFVRSIQRSAQGKHRPIISMLKPSQRLPSDATPRAEPGDA